MSVEQIAAEHWPVPPPGGYRFVDLFTLPDLPKHTELLDGGLVFVAAQTNYHGVLVSLMQERLRSAVGSEHRVRREMLVRFSDRTALEPDLVIVPTDAATDRQRAHYEVPEVLLAVEVESPSSHTRDRVVKPHVYATAGIKHFWRVAWESGPPTIFTYELTSGGTYCFTGEHVERLVVTEPFDIEIDLTEADRL